MSTAFKYQYNFHSVKVIQDREKETSVSCCTLNLIFYFFSPAGIPQLYFTTEPLSKRAPAGESIELQCSAKGEDPIGIAWRRGQEPVHNLDGRIAVLSNGSLWMRLSEDFKDDPYQCCATNAYGTLCSRTAMVVVSGK